MKYLATMRPWQWFKNVIIFIPIFLNISTNENLTDVFITFLLFNFLASGNYILNDIRDINLDKLHPKKKNRPIASGDIEVTKARFLSIFLILVSLSLISLINISLLVLFFTYFLCVNIYTYFLKNTPFINTVFLAFFFLIRLYIGGVASNVEISNLLFLYIFFVSFLLGVLKKKSILFNNDIQTNKYTELLDSENNFISINKIINLTIFLTNSILLLWFYENNFFSKERTILVYIFIILHFTFTVQLSISSKNSELEDIVVGVFKSKKLLFQSLALLVSFMFIYF